MVVSDGVPAAFAALTPRRQTALPLVGQAPPERADAARNRQKILVAAARLVAERGADSLSLDEVARAANVGVGTVYRRFGSRAGLVSAMVDNRELQFQTAFMMGPPPLGPGAPPQVRIGAFLHALLDRLEEQWDLVLVADKDSSVGRYASGPYRMRHIHLVTLLNQLVPGADIHYLADVLLASLSPALLNYQRRVRGYSVERIKTGLDQLVRGLLTAA
jgi:AcrR family transcriptional regulator